MGCRIASFSSRDPFDIYVGRAPVAPNHVQRLVRRVFVALHLERRTLHASVTSTWCRNGRDVWKTSLSSIRAFGNNIVLSRRTSIICKLIKLNLYHCSQKDKSSRDGSRVEESDGGKKNEKENQLKRTKSRELRGGIMYYSCHCIKRNGLQHDCRRTGCGGEPSCLVLPDPLCAPSQLARAHGLADPAPLAAHVRAQGGGGLEGHMESASGSGKRFIVCELKSIVPDISVDKSGKCCKCPNYTSCTAPVSGINGGDTCKCKHTYDTRNKDPTTDSSFKCSCSNTSKAQQSMFSFDENVKQHILKSFDDKVLAHNNTVVGPGGRVRKTSQSVTKKEPCSRPGCLHWQPPSPCVWNAPCKADCFEALPRIQPSHDSLTARNDSKNNGQNTYSHNKTSNGVRNSNVKMKLLNYYMTVIQVVQHQVEVLVPQRVVVHRLACLCW